MAGSFEIILQQNTAPCYKVRVLQDEFLSIRVTPLMSRKPTPSPEPQATELLRFGIVVIAVSIAWGYVAIQMRAWGLLTWCIPAAGILAYWLYGRILLLTSLIAFHKKRIRGVLIWSNSPNWKDYIEKNWQPKIGDRLIILNWSEKERWGKSLPARLFHHFCGTQENYYPSIILFRGLRRPLVYRFFFAFRDYKHGDEKALKGLESHLFRKLELKP